MSSFVLWNLWTFLTFAFVPFTCVVLSFGLVASFGSVDSFSSHIV